MITKKLQLQLGLLGALLAIAILAFGWAPRAHAQALVWSAAGTIDLSNPDIDLTIASGSEATSLVVDTGTFQVVVPSADVFTVSGARTLAVTGVTTATVSDSCVAGVLTMIITGGSGGETITVTPGTAACNAGGSGGSGGSSGGGSSSSSDDDDDDDETTTTTTTTTVGSQVSALIAELKSVVATLEGRGVTISTEVKALLNSLGIPAGGSSSTTTTTTTTVSGTFTSDLDVGASGPQVTALQNWLIKKGYSIPAGATGYFGAQTRAAVAAYQKANGIVPAVGYFGPKTRGHVQMHP